MPGSMVEFAANGHRTPGYLALPPAGKGPALIVLQEYWGLVPHIIALADRFALAGFVSLAPDLYHGEKTTSPDEADKLLMALDIDRAGKDMRGAADFLLAHPAVTSKKAGILGFCMGGQLALYAGMQHPDRIVAVVDFYGIHPKVAIVPSRVRVPVLGHFGSHDSGVPVDTVRELAQAVQRSGGSFTAHFYDTGHAFFNDTRPQRYSKADAELAWTRTLTFLKENVK
jgi:carboxymethylenebutenolidase